jgi:hypothetical protein
MKICSLTLGIFVILISLAQAGPYVPSSKESTVPPPCPTWYADREWNVNLWATYSFPENDYPAAENTIFQGFTSVTGGPLRIPYDTYLESDHAWGGGVDLKYFFARYFGVGLQGFALDARRSFGTVTVLPPFIGPGVGTHVEFGTGYEERLIGGLLATFTLRYPIGCSRFAPYIWVGGGMIFGGGELNETTVSDIPSGAIIERFHRDSETKAIGQFGGGVEVRMTPHIGWTNDFSWNVVDGRDNNFGMARTGINFAF